jgi:hypothetical protein
MDWTERGEKYRPLLIRGSSGPIIDVWKAGCMAACSMASRALLLRCSVIDLPVRL